MNKKHTNIAALAALSFLATACAPNLGGSDYNTADVGSISTTLRGTVLAAKPVNLHGSDPSKLGAGAAIGGVSGALLGSTLGGGRGSLVTGVLGGLAAGAGGHFLEQKITSQEGTEYQVQLDRGDVITIAQGAEPKMSVGQRVLVIESRKAGSRSRIVPDNTY
ncbi:MAG: hypothetical protein NTX76_04500 [Alphaproteobacteria bacterium]|nr:hypothetical protein [Alphaproteobacteria bacterium]